MLNDKLVINSYLQDHNNSILEQRTTSMTLESNIEENAEMVKIAPPTSDVPIQHKDISGPLVI